MLRKLIQGLSVAVAMAVCAGNAIAQAKLDENTSLNLDNGWEFRQLIPDAHSSNGEWLPATVPGDVHLDLLANKKIPDPFYRDNEAKLQWIENASWEYQLRFNVTPELLARSNVDLVFDGLDAAAQVFVNDAPVLDADNMFRIWRVPVRAHLHVGQNLLRIVFPSPIQAAERVAAGDPFRLQSKTADKTYIRKAAYEYGWDWGPRFVTSGIWRPVHLEAWNKVRIADFAIRQRDVSHDVAHLSAAFDIEASVDGAANVAVHYIADGKPVALTSTVQVHKGHNFLEIPIEIQHPRLWYPAGYGEQFLYSFAAQLSTENQIAAERTIETGLRSIELRRQLDQWGRSFEFIVNGIPVFAKGADVIPFDSFPSRVTTADYRRILQSARDANMNMIRVWGGGYYGSDDFYTICDELGIMVWQDFMFGNDWQPGTYTFKLNIEAEAEDQVRRLRNHPSIVLWCGNNEQENNFLQDSLHVTQLARLQMWTDYLTVFSGMIPTLVARYDPGAAYWPSSPSGNYAETKDKNYWILENGDDVGGNQQFGDTHDYSVGTSIEVMPRVPFSSEEDRHYRFVSEYGFQSLPDLQTIDAFTLPQDRTSTSTPVMASHEKGADGYETIHDYLLQYYGEPKNFASLVYGSQVVQAEFIKLVAEHLRRDRPRTMGSLYWQLNDCWPVVSSSSIDYYGRWKALQYYARRFYSPLLVSSQIKDGTLAVSVVSDKTAPIQATLRVRMLKFDGTVLHTQTQTITIPPLSSKVYISIPTQPYATAPANPAETFAAMDLTAGGKQVSSNFMYLVPTSEVHLPAARIESHLTQANGRYQLRLSSSVLARSVYISFGDTDAKVSDNYFDLLPGETMTIAVDSKASLSQLENSMKIISLVDAFVPNTVWKSTAED